LLIVPAVIAAAVLREKSSRRAETAPRERRAFAEIAGALRDRAYRAAATANLADGFAAMGVRSAIVPLFVRDILHRSAIWTGIGFLVVAALNAGALLPAGRLADRFRRRRVMVSGCLVAAAGLVMLALLPGLTGYLAAMAVFGLGSGFLDVGPAAMLGDILGRQGGTVVATYQMAGDVGTVSGPVTAGYLVDVASYGAAFGLGAGVLGLAAVLGLFAPETRWRHQPADPRPALSSPADSGLGASGWADPGQGAAGPSCPPAPHPPPAGSRASEPVTAAPPPGARPPGPRVAPMAANPRCAIGVPNVGSFGDPTLLVNLAVAAEEHGWDGFFVWDHQLWWDPEWDVADPVVVVA